MSGDEKILYSAFKSRDPRFDGRFFVAVKSTGIYCRPTCRAKMPKKENCIFFKTAAEAEAAGYRPCLTCRPELAPGFSPQDSGMVLAERAARYLEENCGSGKTITQLAGELGYTDRYLRKVFTSAYNVTPVRYMQTCRLLLAKELITDTSLSITEIAMISGFGSIRRFNDVFKEQYKMIPSKLRRKSCNENNTDSITVMLGYRKPYRWDLMLDFLKERAIPGVEAVTDNEYMRTVNLKIGTGDYISGVIKVANDKEKSALQVTMTDSLTRVMPQLLTRVKNLFDLYCDPETIESGLLRINSVKPETFVPGIRVPGCIDPFEISVRAVLGQQITVKAAKTLAQRMAETFGEAVPSECDSLRYAFPTAEAIADMGENITDLLGPLGIIASRANAIYELAVLFKENELVGMDPAQIMKKLEQIKGIGPWTSNYICMRAFGYTDAFMETDYGVKQALPGMKPKEILGLSMQWSPWRSYAMMMLWNTEE